MTLLSLLMALLAAGLPGDRGAAASPPNVIFILADDIGIDRVASYGLDGVPARTPVLDGLAQGGLLFRNAWSQPVCSPTRATILTGRQGVNNGIGISIPYENDGPVIGAGGPIGLQPDELPFPRLLKAAGWHTAVVGKWHLGNVTSGGFDHPILMGFDHHAGPRGPADYVDWNKNLAGWWGNTQVMEPGYSSTVTVDDALTFIDAVGDDPFFLWMAFTACHLPLHVPPVELLSQESQDELALIEGDPSLADMHRYMAEAMDAEIGRLLAEMPADVLEQTLVIFMGDNGTPDDALEEPFGVKGAKGSLFEGGIHVPLIMSGTGITAPGREVEGLVNSCDLYATILDVTDVELPDRDLDSLSQVPLMVDPTATPVRRYAYADKFQPNGFGPKSKLRRAIRDQRYKLVRTLLPFVTTPNKFFDLEADPLETTNLVGAAADPLTAEQQAAFERLMEQLLSLEE